MGIHTPNGDGAGRIPRGPRPGYRAARHMLAALACLVVCLPLTGCEPAGKAVGDTQEREPDVAHIGKITADVLIGLIGAEQADGTRDGNVLDALADAQLEAVYVATKDTDDPTATARQGVYDLIDRRASIIVIDGLAVTDANAGSWDDALGDARSAGIPVALLMPGTAPSDETLYAAVLTLDDTADGAVPVGDALRGIIDDHPHDRTITITASAS